MMGERDGLSHAGRIWGHRLWGRDGREMGSEMCEMWGQTSEKSGVSDLENGAIAPSVSPTYCPKSCEAVALSTAQPHPERRLCASRVFPLPEGP